MTSIPDRIDEVGFSNGLRLEWDHTAHTMTISIVNGDSSSLIATLDTDEQERIANAINHNFGVRDALGEWSDMQAMLRSLPK